MVCDTYVEWVDGDEYWSYDHFSEAYNLSVNLGGASTSLLPPEIPPGSEEKGALESIFESVFGVVLGGVQNSGGNGSWSLGFPIGGNSDYGYTLIWRIFEISEEVTDPGDWRPLTPGEILLASLNGIDVPNVERVRLYHRNYRKLLWASAGVSSGQVIAPDGNIFIPPNQTTLPWSENYAVEVVWDRSTFVHEMVHVHQARSNGFGWPRMLKWRLANPDYEYTIVEGQPYEDYGMEQQATMVQDRYLIDQRGYPSPKAPPGITFSELDAVISFIWSGL